MISLFVINALVVLLGIPVFVVVVECLLGLSNRPLRVSSLPNGLRTTVLIPAHNEEDLIIETLLSVNKQLAPGDNVVVVADNCKDKTAAIVREFGFIALERVNRNQRGKGYALDCGLTYLKQQRKPPDIVIIIDADCHLGDKALEYLKQAVISRKSPVQACYLMRRGNVARVAVKISEFAFMVKNKIRLQGLSRLGMPVPLTGTGMAFPFASLEKINLATGDIVEDMRLGVELAEQGMGATYCGQAQVFSYFPTRDSAKKTQRKRWEHGHINTLRQFVPRLLKRALRGPSLQALVMMFDLIVPPLSLLVLLITGAIAAASAWGMYFHDWIHVKILGGYLVLIMLTILLTWYVHGRKVISATELAYIPIYIGSKIFLYLGYFFRKQTTWIRTDRN